MGEVEPSPGVTLPPPEIAQTAITHICPNQGEIKQQPRPAEGSGGGLYDRKNDFHYNLYHL